MVATGGHAEFGKIAAGLRTPNLETEFQVGLRKFSMLLVYVAASLSVVIVAVNLALHRPLLDALLFALAIAVGITPQLLPAVVATSLATGSRRLAARKVLVKRLVCIEDLGNVDVLFTDKTGTLTIGQISFMRAIGRHGFAPPTSCAGDSSLRIPGRPTDTRRADRCVAVAGRGRRRRARRRPAPGRWSRLASTRRGRHQRARRGGR